MKLRWPFGRIRSEQKSLSSPEAWELELFGAAATGTTTILPHSKALSVPAVANCVRVISEAAATLDVKVMAVNDDGTESETRGNPAAQLLQGDANDWTSGFELIRDLVAEALTRDAGGLAWVNRVDGEAREIIKYDPGRISVEYDDAGTGEPLYKLNNRPLDARDVIHVRGPFSKSPLSLAAEAIGLAYILERHAAKLFANGARPGGVIETPKQVGDEGLKRMLSGWRKAHEGSENAGRTAVLFDGATFKALSLTSTDSQFLENRRFQILEICRAFRVPPSMAFELERATWSNSEQMGREFLSYTLEPWLRALEGALSRALFVGDERGKFRILFDRDDLTRASLTERATAINSLRASEVLSADEGRSWLDLPPRSDGQGGAYSNPNINTRPSEGAS